MLDNPEFAPYNVKEYQKTLTETVISLEDRQRAGGWWETGISTAKYEDHS